MNQVKHGSGRSGQRLTVLIVMVMVAVWGGLWLLAGRAAAAGESKTAASDGTIAYVRATTGDEVRLIEANGSNDRRLWAYAGTDPDDTLSVLSIDWHPNGGELAFSSNHERACSIFASDLYGIRPDGSGFRRIGNGPDCAKLASYPKGDVTVTIYNNTSKFNENFYVTMQGAPGVIGVIVPWNGTATVTLPDVADFGAVQQWIALLHTGDSTDQFSDYRWFIGEADVKPGQTVAATPNPATATGDGAPLIGAWDPTWRADGSRLGFARSAGACLNSYAVKPVNPPPGLIGEAIITADALSPCALVWGPTAATAKQVLFLAYPNLGMDGATFYRGTEGTNASSSTKLFSLGSTSLLLWFNWLPDGSGFLYAQTTEMANTVFVEANLFEYNFASGQTTQITNLDDELVRSFSTSPDGQAIVFERAAALDSTSADLWIINRDGSGLRKLVSNGRAPEWGGVGSTPPPPPPLPERISLPLVINR